MAGTDLCSVGAWLKGGWVLVWSGAGVVLINEGGSERVTLPQGPSMGRHAFDHSLRLYGKDSASGPGSG